MAIGIAGFGCQRKTEYCGGTGSGVDNQVETLALHIEFKLRVAKRDLMNAHAAPGSRQVRSKTQRGVESVEVQSQEAPHSRREDHRRRPKLMRTGTAHRLEVSAGKQLSHCAKILLPGEAEILHQMRGCGKRAAGAEFGERSPAREERPNRALVVTDGIEYLLVAADVARAPVG